MNDVADRAKQRHLGRDGAYEVDLEFRRRVALARRQGGVHGASDTRIEQRRDPTAMNRAQRVVMRERGAPLKNGTAFFDFDGEEVERRADEESRQRSRENALEDLHARRAHRPAQPQEDDR